ncbi:MAG: hypothetical protein RSE94_04485 [Pseudomonas sp.]
MNTNRALIILMFAMTSSCMQAPIQEANTTKSSTVSSQMHAGTQKLDLPPPESRDVTAGKIRLDTLGENATITFNYPEMAPNHTVGMRWTGKSIHDTRVQKVVAPGTLTFTIPKTVIANDLGGSAAITASVGVGDAPLEISPPLTVTVEQSSETDPGARTAAALNTRYRNTSNNCANNTPAYYCNGIIIRSVDNGNFDPWDPSPSAVKLGAVSFSYLRIDSYVSDFYRQAGFIFLPQNDAIAQNKAPTYLCIYAYDAGTIVGARPNKGCGLKPTFSATADLSTCASKNATTVQNWYNFTKTIPNRDYQCSLSTQNAAQFAVSYQVRANRPPNMEALWNEMMVNLWPQGHGANLPIEAFFFRLNNNTSLSDAKTFQTKYKTKTGLWKPIIALDFTKLKGSPFSYSSANQAVLP